VNSFSWGISSLDFLLVIKFVCEIENWNKEAGKKKYPKKMMTYVKK